MYRVTHRLACWCFDFAFNIAHWDLRHSTMTLLGKVNRVSADTRQCWISIARGSEILCVKCMYVCMHVSVFV